MADEKPRELLQPALLDRLSDDAPDRRTESRDERVLSLKRLRQCVVRDLEWLLNSCAMTATPPLDPLVAASVLNYGVPSQAGTQAAGLSLPRLEQLLREAIWNFEPRLLRDSVKVRAENRDQMSHNAVTLEVHAQLWAQPLPIELHLRTELDLETGQVVVRQDQEGRT
jgi:type VI secretion system protein ImpF